MPKTTKETIALLLDQAKDRLTYSLVMERFYHRRTLSNSNVKANEQMLAQTQEEISRTRELIDFLEDIDKEESNPNN